jgi:hypothetical protein
LFVCCLSDRLSIEKNASVSAKWLGLLRNAPDWKATPPSNEILHDTDVLASRATRDRGYYLKKYFRQKNGGKSGFFDLKQREIMQTFDHNIGF